MATYYFPRISEQDYPAFQNIAGLDLPVTYEEWLQQQERDKAGVRENDDPVVEVDVNPSEFMRYLQVAKTAADLKELQAFAAAKAGAVVSQ